MDRRRFLLGSASTALLAASSPLLAACRTGDDRATGVATRRSGAADPGTSSTTIPGPVTRYGPLVPQLHADGLLLPAGFRAELLAIGGRTVPGTSYVWHPFPDGGACFPTEDGGWIYANNSEVWVPGAGGAGALRFDADGRIVDAYPLLSGTTMNCAGGATPWGTWLSCEEWDDGQVWECDPFGQGAPAPRPAMGVFRHEMVAADERRRVLYLSEDEQDGLVYRFRPTRWGDLSEGTLDALAVAGDGTTSWVPVGGTGESMPTRYDAPGATPFAGPEGVVLDGSALYVATKHDQTISRLDLERSRLTTFWQGEPIRGPDNLAVHGVTHDLYVCEDGGNMEVVIVSPEQEAAPFLRFVGHLGSEVTGAAFDPSGTRLFVNSQRAGTARKLEDLVGEGGDLSIGRTYMITGPF